MWAAFCSQSGGGSEGTRRLRRCCVGWACEGPRFCLSQKAKQRGWPCRDLPHLLRCACAAAAAAGAMLSPCCRVMAPRGLAPTPRSHGTNAQFQQHQAVQGGGKEAEGQEQSVLHRTACRLCSCCLLPPASSLSRPLARRSSLMFRRSCDPADTLRREGELVPLPPVVDGRPTANAAPLLPCCIIIMVIVVSLTLGSHFCYCCAQKRGAAKEGEQVKWGPMFYLAWARQCGVGSVRAPVKASSRPSEKPAFFARDCSQSNLQGF